MVPSARQATPGAISRAFIASEKREFGMSETIRSLYEKVFQVWRADQPYAQPNPLLPLLAN